MPYSLSSSAVSAGDVALDNQYNDLRTDILNMLPTDGSEVMQDNIDMDSNQTNQLAAAAASGDAVRYDEFSTHTHPYFDILNSSNPISMIMKEGFTDEEGIWERNATGDFTMHITYDGSWSSNPTSWLYADSVFGDPSYTQITHKFQDSYFVSFSFQAQETTNKVVFLGVGAYDTTDPSVLLPRYGNSNTKHIGFWLDDLSYAGNANGSSRTKTEVTSYAGDCDDIHNYSILVQGSVAKFYIDGTLVATNSSNMPTGTCQITCGITGYHSSGYKYADLHNIDFVAINIS